MNTHGFQSELARQLCAWAELEQNQDGRQGLMQLADEYERIAVSSDRPAAVAQDDQRKAA
jgi:hypothetical protein